MKLRKIDLNFNAFTLRYLLYISLAFSMLLSSGVATAKKVDVLPCEVLKSEESKGQCKIYVLGFLEGAILTDAAIIENLSGDKSDFLKRVYETRGVRQGYSLPSTYFAKFCLPEGLSNKEAVAKVINYMSGKKLKYNSVDKRVYASFRANFPCN